MKTVAEILSEKYQLIKSGEMHANSFHKWCKNREDIIEFINIEGEAIFKNYTSPTYPQIAKYIFDDKKIHLCECGKPRTWRNLKKGYNKTCSSKECKGEKNVESLKKHYMEKYGVDHLFKTDEFKQRFKETSMEKYGVDNPGKNKEIIERIKQTNIDRFGETSWLKVKGNSDKIAKKLEEINSAKRDEIILKFQMRIKVLMYDKKREAVKILCDKCNIESEFSTSFFRKRLSAGIDPCLTCNPPLYACSVPENEMCDFIESIYNNRIVKNYKIPKLNKEIDVYLPDLNIGFEFDGIYWHSEIFKGKFGNINKKKAIRKEGIRLYNIWEDDWLLKKDLMKSRISALLKTPTRIHARKCIIKNITPKEERDFLMSNHLQGYSPSKIKLGLFHNYELISLMTFGERRKSLGSGKKQGEYELIRFCSKKNHIVIGGASKLFSNFIKKYDFNKIISYQDNSWGTGNLYEKLGFTLINDEQPNYWWCKGNLRFGRFNYRKDKLISEGYDPDKTGDEIMSERGYYKLWDYGSLKWEYIKKILE